MSCDYSGFKTASRDVFVPDDELRPLSPDIVWCAISKIDLLIWITNFRANNPIYDLCVVPIY